MPEVSVIVPVYKVEPYLRQCVDSVLAQTFTDFELILVDDGSPDNCGAICDEYAEKDCHVKVIHKENGGQGRARNIGMDQATGKYIIFLDSDDYWLPETLEILHSEAERNQTQVLAFGAIPFWDGMEEPESHLTYSHTVQNGIVKSGAESLKTALDAKEYYSVPWGRFFLLDYVRDMGLHFDEGIIHEDAKFSFLSYLFADRVECINAQFYQYRIRPDSTMRSKSAKNSAHGCRVVLDGLLEAYFSQPCTTQQKELLARYIDARAEMIRGQYSQAIKQKQDGSGTARLIQDDARETLKRVRAVPGISKTVRLCTYSLFWGWLLPGIYRKLRRALRRSEE